MPQDFAPLIDMPSAPEIFVDATLGFALHAGVVDMTFVVARCDHSLPAAPVRNHVVLRLAMPIGGAQGLTVALYDFLRQRGGLPAGDGDKQVAEPAAEPAPTLVPSGRGEKQSDLVDDGLAPHIFADSTAGFHKRAEITTITFATNRHDHIRGVAERVVVLRLVLPAMRARNMAQLLFDFLRSHGFDPAPRPADTLVQ